MTTLAELLIIASADNCPPMLEKSLYDSWKSRMELYIENRENIRMILNLLQNGPLVWTTVIEEDGTTRTKKYEELSVAEKLKADCDLKATNIVLQGLPPDVYAIVNHYKVAKEIWDRVKLFIQGTKFSLEEKECLAIPVFNQGDDLIACLNKAMAFLTVVASSRRQGQSYAGNSYKCNATSSGGNNAGGQAKVVKCYNYQDEEQLAFLADPGILDSGLMANVSNYGSDVISEEKANQEKNNESLTTKLEGYKERVKTFEQRLNIDLSTREKMIDSQMDDMIKEKLALKQQINSLEQKFSNQIKEKESLLQTFIVFKNESKEKESRYIDKDIDLEKKIKELDNIVYKVGQSAQTVHMLTKPQVFYDDTHKQALDIDIGRTQLQAKDTTICKLKEHIKSMRENDKEEKVKVEMDEIETINIELEHCVAKLLSENERLHKEIENLKKIFKDHFDSIKNTRALSKEHCDSLIAQLNSKSMENVDLKGMFKLDIKPLSHRLKNNRDTHEDYLKKTIENTNTIRGLVERARKQNHSKPLLDSAFKFTKHRQELLVYVSQTCPSFTKPSKKLIVLWYLDSECSKHMIGNRSQLMNFVSKFLGTVRFKNDQVAKIMGYGDYQLGNVIISRVYYVQGLGNHLFSIGQFCDADLELAFRKNTCFIWNLEGVDLLSGSRDTNLYTISLDDMLKTSPICLLSKASKTKSLLWHRRLSHLNFTCALGKSQKSSHQPKAEDTNQEKLYLLHMDLCSPLHVESINRKKYILVIVDDYSRFTWVKFLRSKDEAPDVIIKCIKNIQVPLNATVCNIRTDNGTKFVIQTLCDFYENVSILHQTFVARTP
ncbi:retrovirus-related pol polyprotein from transposon TNT 1-94 [Tanacetum coccineum]